MRRPTRHSAGYPPTPGTLAHWLLQATERLDGRGLPSPRVDAQRLAAHGLGVRWTELWMRLREQLRPEQIRTLAGLLERRAAWEPLAYILGWAQFCGLTLEVGPGVLVPRPETETLVDVALPLAPEAPGAVLVDVGTGSGAIALALATARPGARVVATEVSPDALEYAMRNAAAIAPHVELLLGDAFAALPDSLRGGVDLVVCNPPYIAEHDEHTLAPDVLREPREALFAGDEGAELLLRIVREAPRWLRPGGAVALEVGTPEQADTVRESMRDWTRGGVEQDASGRPRVVWGTR